MRPLIFALVVALAPRLGLAGPALTRVVNLSVEAEKVEYNREEQTLRTEGTTEIRSEIEGDPERRLLIRTQEARADLNAGRVEAAQGVEFVIPHGYLRGEGLTLETEPPAFSLRGAQAVVDLTPQDGAPVLGQLRGEEISGRGSTLTLRGGMISPCMKETPDISFQAGSLEFDPQTHRLKVKRGVLQVYGLRLPLLFDWTERIGAERESTHKVLPMPRYSKRDGLLLPYYFDLTRDRSDLRSTLEVHLTAKRGVTFVSETVVPRGRWVGEAYASRMEDVRGKMFANLVYDRLPELRLTGYQRSPRQEQGWRASLSLGNFYERDQTLGGPPEVHRWRGQIGAGYLWGGQARRRSQGAWAEVAGTYGIYSKGGSYSDLAVTLGGGRRFTPALGGSLEFVHHFLGGQTPFQFDAVDLKTELRPALQARLTETWRLKASGRWDLDSRRLRDYYLELGKRMHCLTWSVFYRFIGGSVGLRLDINGLTGDTEPPPLTEPLAQEYLKAQEDLNRPAVTTGGD